MTSSGLRRDLVARHRLRDRPDDVRDRGLARVADDDGQRVDAAVMYTKLMWLRHRSAAFIHQLLAYPLAENAWTRSMRARRQPTMKDIVLVARLL